MTAELRSFGWVRRPNGDIWDGPDEKRAKPVAYRVGNGWMISGVRSAEELAAITKMVGPE